MVLEGVVLEGVVLKEVVLEIVVFEEGGVGGGMVVEVGVVAVV